MNKFIYKIIGSFLFIIILIILSFYTFFAGEKKEIDKSDFNISHTGEKNLSGAILDKVDFYTTIYSKNKNYIVNKNEIKLGTGIYLIDSRDVFSEKVLKMGTNDVILKGGGLVYINNNTNKKTISSFNNKIKVQFINKTIGKKGVEVYLYPHMYFTFRPYRFANIEQADSLRVSQLGKIGYFNNGFKEINNFTFIQEKNKDFLDKTIKNLIDNQIKYSKKLDKIKNTNIGNIVGVDFIEQYFTIFYNDRKKVIYYKNKTLNLLIQLLKENNNKIINEILENIALIEELDDVEANKMKEITKEIFYLVSYDLSDNSDMIQERYDSLVSKLFKINDTRKIKLIKDVDRYNYLGDFTKFINLSILDIENKDLSLLDKEYYVLFKQNILVSNISSPEIDEKYFNILLKGFISYSENIEKNISVENKDAFLTNVKYNINLLQTIEKSFKNRYFELERDSQDLLILKEGTNIYNIEKIIESIKILENKFKKSEKYLKENIKKYGYIIKDYNEILPKIKEYTDALNNYTLYKKKYSKVNKALLGVEVYEDDEDRLSKQKFIDYISNFSGINLSSINVEVFDYYYKINNIGINGKEFSFDLLPYTGNTIQNIVYKNNGIYRNSREKGFYNHIETTSYSLDKEKEKYKELFSKAKNDEKEKYNFRNFFKNTFILSNSKGVEDFELIDKNNEDDEIIQTFKRAKLLGNKGEFRNIKDIFNVNYSNFDVERKTGKIFLIKIIDALLRIDVKDGNKNIKYGAIFTSDYKLENNKHYFYNMKIKPYKIQGNSDKKYILNDNLIKISGKIKIGDFKNKMNELFQNLSNIEKDYRKKSETDNISQIIYSATTGKYYIN